MTTCESCIHWLPAEFERQRAYSAPCARGYGKPAFNASCPEHEPPKPLETPALSQQSQARGMPYYAMGGKP